MSPSGSSVRSASELDRKIKAQVQALEKGIEPELGAEREEVEDDERPCSSPECPT